MDPLRKLDPVIEKRLAAVRAALVRYVKRLGLDAAARAYAQEGGPSVAESRLYLEQLVADEATYKERGPK